MTLEDFKRVRQLTGDDLVNAYHEYMRVYTDYSFTVERIGEIEKLLMNQKSSSESLMAEMWDLTNQLTISKITSIPSITTHKDFFKYEQQQSNQYPGAHNRSEFEIHLRFPYKRQTAKSKM